MMIVASIAIVSSLFLVRAAFRFKKIVKGLNEQLNALAQELKQLQRNHAVLVNADLGFAKQIAEINRLFASMDNQLHTLENKRDNDGGYQHALRILEMGGDKEEIITSCHLSNAEAELLMNLHAYRTVIKTHPHRGNS
ncbi:hypothetical protein clem_04115 [Legionella clemsonensis]|uniref:DUF2802 domain-containing protein n=2 Tax=Legionella clemsonensis TaxID=1867846 RepID=A0A222P0N3_9GAMM|nr:DUF2802 domain-containing protein [Legionella clemsonensis]ASQ45381.1 hypothetical protein clem_04115 [Legionella clemsonensis]